jgi:nucleotide-binding universal stress UspA family protein
MAVISKKTDFFTDFFIQKKSIDLKAFFKIITMEKSDKELIVTYDFTKVSDNAVEHAMRISKYTGSDVKLIHVVDDDSDAELRKEEAGSKLRLICDECFSKHGIKPGYEVLSGSIFSAIGKYASEVNARMVIMGTHGIKGMQKLTGSRALKVIVSSKVPFLVVQDKPSEKRRFTDIVFPIDFKLETREKLYWAIYLGKYFNSRIHLYKPPVSSDSIVKKINTNLNFAVRYLIQNNIDYEVHVGKSNGDFGKETVAFAQEINADLILIMTTKGINVTDYVLGVPEQQLIANNARIPVMAVNPRVGTSSFSSVMY